MAGRVHQEHHGAGDVDSVAGLRRPPHETGPPRQRVATPLLPPQRRLSLLLRRHRRRLGPGRPPPARLPPTELRHRL